MSDEPQEVQRIIFQLSDEDKKHVAQICERIIRVLLEECEGAPEAYFVLHCVLEALEKEFNIAYAQFLDYPTTKLQ